MHLQFIYFFFLALYVVADPNQKDKRCLLLVSEGGCNEQILSWFYNVKTGTCQTFVYSGCGGNANNFNNSMYCLLACNGTEAATHQYLFDKSSSELKQGTIGSPDRSRELSVIRALHDGRNKAEQRPGSNGLPAEANIMTTKEPGLLQHPSPNSGNNDGGKETGSGSNRQKREVTEEDVVSQTDRKEKQHRRLKQTKEKDEEIVNLKKMVLQLSRSIGKLESGNGKNKNTDPEKLIRRKSNSRQMKRKINRKEIKENEKLVTSEETARQNVETISQTGKELEKKIDIDVEEDDELEIVSTRIQSIIRDPAYVFSCNNMSAEDRKTLEEISSDMGYMDALSLQVVTEKEKKGNDEKIIALEGQEGDGQVSVAQKVEGSSDANKQQMQQQQEQKQQSQQQTKAIKLE